ncbi:FkbM family methyltransferase [Natronorarus salvus]|uniref:FkbM family methyltransferase n=1 Tax=Natronorarus salvus TaxID=3117733 RepID=UPI002F26119A
MLSWNRPVEIYRSEGVVALGARTTRLLGNRLADAYWVGRRSRPITVAGVTATFPIDGWYESYRLRRSLSLERPMLRDLLRSLGPEDVFYDVGAHVGLYSCFAARVVGGDSVVAFEPDPENVETLCRNLSYNASGAKVLDCALASEGGTVVFEGADGPFRSRGSIVADGGPNATVVEQRAGDALVAAGEIPPPTVLKIDVEGAESLVIDGLSGSLADDRCRLVYCELHRESDRRPSAEDCGSTPAEVTSRLRSLGFETEVLCDRSAELLVKAERLG